MYGESFIGAKGDVGGFRFAIPDKDYAIALKPHQVGKEKFMRLTVYDRNGEIVNKTVCKDGPVFMGDEVIWE